METILGDLCRAVAANGWVMMMMIMNTAREQPQTKYQSKHLNLHRMNQTKHMQIIPSIVTINFNILLVDLTEIFIFK
jgi:hypothetical protein